MSGTRPMPQLARKALLLGLGVVAVYAALIPLGPGGGLVPPDLLYCLVIACAIRSPAATQIWIVVLLGLIADVMLSRPIGLGALGLVLTAEAVRARAGLFHGASFVLEWLAAVAAFALMLMGVNLVLRLAFVEGPGLGPSIAYVAATALAYPVVVAGLVWGLGLRAPRALRAGDPLRRLT